MKNVNVDGFTEKIAISKKEGGVNQPTTQRVYYNGYAQIKPFQYRETLEGGVQASETRYLLTIYNRNIPLANGDTITWQSNNQRNLRLRIEDFAHCSSRDVYRTIRATATSI